MMNEETKASLNKFLKERGERIKNMTLDEAIKHCEEVAEEQDMRAGFETDYQTYTMSKTARERCRECANEHRQLAEWLKELKQLREQTRWISVSEIGYPKPEDEYKHFITIDNKGEITIQEFLLSLDEEPQPYFSGMRNIVAYINMPLPEPYKEDTK